MLQWMGGARRKMNATKDSKLKRQRDFFNHRKEKRGENEFGGESGKIHTLAEYLRQNLHGGESLDILGLRSLNPASADVTAANPDVSLPDPATKSATQSCRTIDEPEQQSHAYVQPTPGVATAAQQEMKQPVNRKTDLPLPGKGRDPVHLGNLQTKKVASTAPRSKLLDMISNDLKCDNRGKKRFPLEDYAVFSQDEIGAIDRSIFDQVADHPQQTFNISDRKQPHASSLQLEKSYVCYPETLVPGSSDLLGRFLSTQKLKVHKQADEHANFKTMSSHQHGRQPQKHNKTQSLLNSFRVSNKECHNLDFMNPIFNMTNVQVKQEPSEVNYSNASFGMENFHVKQELGEFDFSDPFVNIIDQVKEERQEHEYLNPGYNISNYQVMQDYPYLSDLNYDRSAFNIDSKLFDHTTGLENFQNDPVIGESDSRWNISSTIPNLKREFPTHEHSRSVQIPSCDRSRNSDLPQSRTYKLSSANLKRRKMHINLGSSDVSKGESLDMSENFPLHLENREIAAVNFDKSRLLLDGFEGKIQDMEATLSLFDDYSPRQMSTSRSNFENECSDWNDDEGKNCTFSEQWKYESSESRDVLCRQENIDPAHSGRMSDQTHNLHDVNSWSQSVAGESLLHLLKHDKAQGSAADHFSDYLTGDLNVMQEKDSSRETQKIIAPEILQDLKPLLSPQINCKDDDIIIVCFPDSEDCPTVETLDLPIQSVNIPLQVFDVAESPSRMKHDVNVLSSDTSMNRISQEINVSNISSRNIAAAKAMTTIHDKLFLGREDSICDTVLTRNIRQSQKDEPLPALLGSLGKDIEELSWQVKEPQLEVYSELQTPKTRRSSNLLLIEEKRVEDGSEHHCSNSDKADPWFSSEFLYEHAVGQELLHNFEGNSLEVCSPLKGLLEKSINGMSTTKVGGMPQKQRGIKIAQDHCCQVSFSSQEECSPAYQLNKVQTVLCKLQRPVYSCGSKLGKVPEHGIQNVDTVLFKLQRPIKPSPYGLHHQDPEENYTLQEDIKQTNETNLKTNSESEIKPIAECGMRLLVDLNANGSRLGSLPLPNVLQKNAISVVPDKEEPSPRVSDSPARDADQDSFQGSQRKLIAVVPDKEHPSLRESEPQAGNAKQNSPPISQRNATSVVHDVEHSSLRESDKPAEAGVLGYCSTALQVSDKQTVIVPSQDLEGIHIFQQSPATTRGFKQDERYSTNYVKNLESYVIQLKLEVKALRLSSGS